MKKNLMSIAMGLSEKELMELVRLKKDGGKKLVELRRERNKLATAIAKIDKKLAEYGEGAADAGDVETAPRKTRRGRGRGRKAAKAAVKPASKTKGAGRGKRRAAGLTEAVRNVVANAADPVRASDIVDALPGVGFKVKDVAATRKRVSIILATQKGSFQQVGRGLYQAVAE